MQRVRTRTTTAVNGMSLRKAGFHAARGIGAAVAGMLEDAGLLEAVQAIPPASIEVDRREVLGTAAVVAAAPALAGLVGDSTETQTAEQEKLTEMSRKLLLGVGAKKGHVVLVPCDSNNKIVLAEAVVEEAKKQEMNAVCVDVSEMEPQEQALALINQKAEELGIGTRSVDDCNIINLLGGKSLRGRMIYDYARKDKAYVLHLAVENAKPGDEIEMKAIEALLTRDLDELEQASDKLMDYLKGAQEYKVTTRNSKGETSVLKVKVDPKKRALVRSIGNIRESSAKWGNIGGEIYIAPTTAEGQFWLKEGTLLEGYKDGKVDKDTLLDVKVKTIKVKHKHLDEAVDVDVGMINLNSLQERNPTLKEYLEKHPEYLIVSELGMGLMGGEATIPMHVLVEKLGPHLGLGDMQAERGTVIGEAKSRGDYYSSEKHEDICFPDADIEVQDSEGNWKFVYKDGELAPELAEEMFPAGR